MKRSPAAVLLALALLATGCAGNPLRRDDPRDQEIADLRARLLELQRKTTVSEVELARLRQQVAELETARPGGPRVTPPPVLTPPPPPVQAPAPKPAAPKSTAPAAVPARPTTMAAAPSRSPAAVAPRPPATSAHAGGIEEVDIDMPPPVVKAKPAPPAASVPSATSAPVAPAPVAKAPVPQPPGGAETSGPATQALYDRGYTLFHQGRYVDAEASFQRFLQANPSNELADNAEYWIGECRYSRGDLRGALAAFRETVQRYPDGNKVPDALLKAGQCLEAMGDVAGARVTYKEVIRRFSGSAAATVAEEHQAKLPQ